MKKMSLDPIKFDFKLMDLPLSLKDIPKEKINEAVSSFFSEYFEEIGGEVTVNIDSKYVTVTWIPNSLEDTENAIQEAIGFLKKGQIVQGEVMLTELHKRFPDHPTILFNYGMILSDKGRLDDSIKMLSRLTEIDNDHAQAWNALAVANMRKGNEPEALENLKKSYQLNPEDPYTLRNLGSLIAKGSEEKALPYLQKAAQLLPEDPQAQYGYGLCLMGLERYDEADSILKKVISIAPYTELKENAKELRSKIGSIKMRKDVGSQPRMDVVMYCLAALEKFEKLPQKKRQAITYEIAMLGRNGLDLNNPESKYTLKALPGEFTGMQLVSYMYVGLKQIDQNLDPGIDLKVEYKMALNLFDKKPK